MIADEITEQDLMARINAVGEEYRLGLPTNRRHRQEAMEAAKRYGVEPLLAGLTLWLKRDETLQELAIGPAREDSSLPLKSWILHEFLVSGSGLTAIKNAARYGNKPARLLATMVEGDIKPDLLTPDHWKAMKWILKNGLWDDFKYLVPGKDLTYALGHARELVVEKKKAPYDASKWNGYELFAAPLLALEAEAVIE